MRRFLLILLLLLIAGSTVHEAYDVLVVHRGIDYYRSQPWRILLVVLLALLGGLAPLALSRLSPGVQRRLKLVALGTLDIALFAFLVVFVVEVGRSAVLVSMYGVWPWIVACFASLLVIVGLVAFEFRQVYRIERRA